MVEIEFDEPHFDECDCCGRTTTRATRFVKIDGEARAVYFVKFAEEHPEPHAAVLLAIGEFWKDEDRSSRVAFGLRIWSDEEKWVVSVVDASSVGWDDSRLMGRRLTREEALAHPGLRQAFHVSDHIVAEDQLVSGYFDRALGR